MPEVGPVMMYALPPAGLFVELIFAIWAPLLSG
jgi:hypothetical protein